jgi:predicted N-acyltransferase
MPDGREAYAIRVLPRLKDLGAGAWDACAGHDNPFVSHAFLTLLEESGSATAEAGWLPQHLVLEDGAGGIMGAVPMYLKSDSYGEYVFDHGWAAAFERAGGRYYPKLQVAVPFTPVTGPRLLVKPGLGAMARNVERALINGLEEAARRLAASSVHVTFLPEDQWRRLGGAGWLLRTGCQFYWENRGYRSFEEFLVALSARKRKSIRKERRAAEASGLTVRVLAGPEVSECHWDAFFRFYESTSDRKWGWPYLTRAFFSGLGAAMPERVVLMFAERNGRPVAGALNLLGSDTLFGRYWGCLGQYKFLHFELCYYRAIDFAIAHGLARVEAGAQGPHKIQRGYLPRRTYSAHWIRHPGLSGAVGDFLARERAEVEADLRALERHSPFRRDEGPAPEAAAPGRADAD